MVLITTTTNVTALATFNHMLSNHYYNLKIVVFVALIQDIKRKVVQDGLIASTVKQVDITGCYVKDQIVISHGTIVRHHIIAYQDIKEAMWASRMSLIWIIDKFFLPKAQEMMPYPLFQSR